MTERRAVVVAGVVAGVGLSVTLARALSRRWQQPTAFAQRIATAWANSPASALSPHNTALPPSAPTHIKLTAQEFGHKRRAIVVGDVHGCADEFEMLLAKCGFDQAQDLLVMVGDLVNKGPASVGVVERAMALGAVCVRGNHDDSALNACIVRRLALAELESWWPSTRLQASRTLQALDGYSWTDQLTEAHVNFLNTLPYTAELPPHLWPTLASSNTPTPALVVHAGLVPGRPLDAQTLGDLYKMRDVACERGSDGTVAWRGVEQPRTKRGADEGVDDQTAWAKAWDGPWFVCFGHDAKRKLQTEAMAVGLDTGCCYGGSLTAIELPSRQLVSVDALRAYAAKKG